MSTSYGISPHLTMILLGFYCMWHIVIVDGLCKSLNSMLPLQHMGLHSQLRLLDGLLTHSLSSSRPFCFFAPSGYKLCLSLSSASLPLLHLLKEMLSDIPTSPAFYWEISRMESFVALFIILYEVLYGLLSGSIEASFLTNDASVLHVRCMEMVSLWKLSFCNIKGIESPCPFFF